MHPDATRERAGGRLRCKPSCSASRPGLSKVGLAQGAAKRPRPSGSGGRRARASGPRPIRTALGRAPSQADRRSGRRAPADPGPRRSAPARVGFRRWRALGAASRPHGPNPGGSRRLRDRTGCAGRSPSVEGAHRSLQRPASSIPPVNRRRRLTQGVGQPLRVKTSRLAAAGGAPKPDPATASPRGPWVRRGVQERDAPARVTAGEPEVWRLAPLAAGA